MTKKEEVEARRRARTIEHLRKSVQRKHPMDIIVCRPEYEDEVRELVEEAGVDMRIVTDPEAHGYFSLPNRPLFEHNYPELARQMPERPPQRLQEERQQPQSNPASTPPLQKPRVERHGNRQPEARIVLYRPERPQTVRVETGPQGTQIHLDG